jgi:hypothetical protein
LGSFACGGKEKEENVGSARKITMEKEKQKVDWA